MNNLEFYEPRKEPEENECEHENERAREGDFICSKCKEHCSIMECPDCDESFGSDCCGAE